MEKLIFFGSSDYSVPVLQKLLDRKINVVAVVTTRDKPVGRHLKLTPNSVKLLAKKNTIPVITDYKELIGILPAGSVGLVTAFGRIIPANIVNMFNAHIYNIHPSLLPKYRGPSPLQQQILDGIKNSGVTLIQLDEQMDHGPIAAVQKDTILEDDTSWSLGSRLFDKGTDLFIGLLPDLASGKTDKYEIQDESLATFTKKITREEGFIDYPEFNKFLTSGSCSLDIPRLLRAYTGWPGVWTLNTEGKRIKLISANPEIIIQIEGQKPKSIQSSDFFVHLSD